MLQAVSWRSAPFRHVTDDPGSWCSIRMALRPRLERYFEFEALGTNWRTELLAGVTTFVTMA